MPPRRKPPIRIRLGANPSEADLQHRWWQDQMVKIDAIQIAPDDNTSVVTPAQAEQILLLFDAEGERWCHVKSRLAMETLRSKDRKLVCRWSWQ